MSLKLNTASGGSITLQEADTASNLTITVPAVTGTMLTTASAGTVLQVVNATYAIQQGSSSSTYADTGLTASITPSSSTSKILVFANQAGMYKSGGVDRIAGVQLVRGASALALMEAEYGNSISNGIGGSLSICFLDSPATTSSVTYKTQFRSTQNNSAVYVQITNAVSTITLMEIAA
jgi:hypothetical protein